jgi:hypothetical protein|tara:strand:- start:212 stop:715 length:504 start_codon:yes stop_codon:yes gene_type:complete
MSDFNQDDIIPLDFIINQLLTKDIVTADNLIKNNLLTKNNNEIQEFVRYLHILNEYGVCECHFSEDAEFARLNQKTLHFQKQGGFRKLFSDSVKTSNLEKHKSNLEIENLELQKENFNYQKSIRNKESQIRDLTRDNLRLGNWDIRFRWLIAIATFVAGFILRYLIE